MIKKMTMATVGLFAACVFISMPTIAACTDDLEQIRLKIDAWGSIKVENCGLIKRIENLAASQETKLDTSCYATCMNTNDIERPCKWTMGQWDNSLSCY